MSTIEDLLKFENLMREVLFKGLLIKINEKYGREKAEIFVDTFDKQINEFLNSNQEEKEIFSNFYIFLNNLTVNLNKIIPDIDKLLDEVVQDIQNRIKNGNV